MHRKALATIAVKFFLAALLAGSTVVASAGTIRCLLGIPMACAMAEKPVQPEKEDCCHPQKAAPKKANKCCCLDAKKSPHESATTTSLDLRLDFPILLDAPIQFVFANPIVVVSQIRWPEVHGPPGSSQAPTQTRAPPVI